MSDFMDVQYALQNVVAERESDGRLISGSLEETMHSPVQQYLSSSQKRAPIDGNGILPAIHMPG